MGIYIPITVVDFNSYRCEPSFPTIQLELLIQMNLLAQFAAARDQEDPETGEPICVPDSTARDHLMTGLLQSMGRIALLFPFDRAVYPLPSGDAIEVPT